MTHLRENMGAIDVTLSDEVRGRIRAAQAR